MNSIKLGIVEEGFRTEIFKDIQKKFISANKEDLMEIALQSSKKLIAALSNENDKFKLGTLLIGAKLGISGSGEINKQEKELFDIVIKQYIKSPSMEYLYEIVGQTIKENDFEFVKLITTMGNNVAIPFLYYLLSFAYIDGKVDDEIIKKIDGLYGIKFLAEMLNNDEEDTARLVTVIENWNEEEMSEKCKIQLNEFEESIVKWFSEFDDVNFLTNIQEHFCEFSKEDVKKALDGLVEKGILYNVDTVVGEMYGLNY